MKDIGQFYGTAPFLGDFKIAATLAAGTISLWAAGNAGGIQVSVTTSLADAMGLVVAASQGQTLTYSTVQGATEGIATVIYDPFRIYEVRIVPSATAGTAYANADGYFLTEDNGESAGTTITDGQVGNADAEDGMVFGLTGANSVSDQNHRAKRIITAANSNTSIVVTVPFPNDIDAGDTFVYSQYAPGVLAVQLTSDLTQADGTIAGGTGGDARVLKVRVETVKFGSTVTAPQLYLQMVLLDHAFNSFTN